jgi:phage shock protein PspC (stress-responsive transcriptional regulator)
MLPIGLTRSRRNRMFLGVCGGIAEHLDVSSKLVRFVTILLAVFLPGISIWAVLIAYVVLGIVLPQEDSLRA